MPASEVKEWDDNGRGWQCLLLLHGLLSLCPIVSLAFVCVNWSSNSSDYIASQSTERDIICTPLLNECLGCVGMCQWPTLQLVATMQSVGLCKMANWTSTEALNYRDRWPPITAKNGDVGKWHCQERETVSLNRLSLKLALVKRNRRLSIKPINYLMAVHSIPVTSCTHLATSLHTFCLVRMHQTQFTQHTNGGHIFILVIISRQSGNTNWTARVCKLAIVCIVLLVLITAWLQCKLDNQLAEEYIWERAMSMVRQCTMLLIGKSTATKREEFHRNRCTGKDWKAAQLVVIYETLVTTWANLLAILRRATHCEIVPQNS